MFAILSFFILSLSHTLCLLLKFKYRYLSSGFVPSSTSKPMTVAFFFLIYSLYCCHYSVGFLFLMIELIKLILNCKHSKHSKCSIFRRFLHRFFFLCALATSWFLHKLRRCFSTCCCRLFQLEQSVYRSQASCVRKCIWIGYQREKNQQQQLLVYKRRK